MSNEIIETNGPGKARGAPRETARTRCVTLAAAALIAVLAPAAARADCDVPDDGTGIPEDVAFKADVAGTRAALANAGIGIGGV
jgi:hypothetical protein